MSKSLTLIITILLFSFGSCKKETATEVPNQVDNYITFSIGTTIIEAKYKVLLQDDLFNGYNVLSKSISLQRLVTNGSPQRIIFAIDRLDLNTKTLPITIKYNTNTAEPTVSVTYVNADNMPFGTNINNPDDFTLTINSYTDQVLNCSFTGKLYSGISSNPNVDLTNGSLNLELVEK